MDPDFADNHFDQLAVTHNFRGSPHIDKTNTGPFIAISFGNFRESGPQCAKKDSDSFKADVEADYFLIENTSKPLKAVSAYGVAQLQEICRRLTVPILDSTGKKVGKKAM